MINTKNKKCSPQAFSLIELLIVIAIIALLLGILLPSLGKFMEQGYKARTISAIATLSNGALQYKEDTKYYPGQRYITRVGCSPTHITGSQMLAACLLDGLSISGGGSSPTPTGTAPTENYIPYKDGETTIDPYEFIMQTQTIRKYYTLSDRWGLGDPRAILYYPSRIGNDGAILTAYTDGAFRNDDNGAYAGYVSAIAIDESTQPFRTAIWDRRFGDFGGTVPNAAESADKAYNSDSFLLIGAGIDRKYFKNLDTLENDDITNFKK